MSEMEQEKIVSLNADKSLRRALDIKEAKEIMKTFKKSEIRAKLVDALEILDNNDIPSEFSLLSNLDRGRVEYRNNRIWDFDFTITYHKGENIVFFNYKGNEEPQFNWQKQLQLSTKNN